MDKIIKLIEIYRTTATNLRKVAEAAEEKDPTVARVSRAKAMVYDLVVLDLEAALRGEESY